MAWLICKSKDGVLSIVIYRGKVNNKAYPTSFTLMAQLCNKVESDLPFFEALICWRDI